MMRREKLTMAVQQYWSRLWLIVLAVVSFVLLVATALFYDRDIASMTHLTYTYENNFGAWWSGMLLLIGSVHAFDGYKLWKAQRTRLAQGWAAMSLILLILSLDEIGSLHEWIGFFLPGNVWLNILPFAVILLALFAFVFVTLWSNRDQRRALALLTLAIVCFAATAGQEYLEHYVEWEELERVTRGTRAAFEEGTEITGMLLIIAASIPNTQGIFRRGRIVASPVLEAPFSWREYVLPVALVLSPILAFVSVKWLNTDRGQPVNWLSSTLFMLTALAALRPFLRPDARATFWHWVLAGSALLASAFSTGLNNMMPYALAGLSTVMALAWLFVPAALKMRRRLLNAVALFVVGLSLLVQPESLMLYQMPALTGLLVYGVTTGLIERPARERAQPAFLERVNDQAPA